MSRDTQPYKRSFAGSIGAGMGSLMGGSGKRYYILEHKVSSKYHKAGEGQEIIVDEVEIGRDPKCQVRFDDYFETVSRRHAAIVKEGDNWKLVPLSQTNPTLLNGKRVAKEWFLQNGDEIQCSINGPKLGFFIPTGNKSTVGSIGLSRRLSLFRQQALRPYKQALTMLCIFMILSIGGLSGWKIYGDIQHKKELETIEKLAIATADSLRRESAKERARMDSIIAANSAQLASSQTQLAQMRRDFEEHKRRNSSGGGGIPAINNAAIDACVPHVYFIFLKSFTVTTISGETGEVEAGISGTGFLLNDGRFVTARHVAEPWLYCSGEDDEGMLLLNLHAHNGGKVIANFAAFSKTGNAFEFSSDMFKCDRSADVEQHTAEGYRLKIATPDATDWAYIRTSETGGLPFDVNLSRNLNRGAGLTVLGFPQALGANSPQDIQPIYGNGTVSIQGLHNGVITTTNTNYEQGNSGGPVFYDDGGTLKVVGIVSAGLGRTIGFIVPVAALN